MISFFVESVDWFSVELFEQDLDVEVAKTLLAGSFPNYLEHSIPISSISWGMAEFPDFFTWEDVELELDDAELLESLMSRQPSPILKTLWSSDKIHVDWVTFLSLFLLPDDFTVQITKQK